MTMIVGTRRRLVPNDGSKMQARDNYLWEKQSRQWKSAVAQARFSTSKVAKVFVTVDFSLTKKSVSKRFHNGHANWEFYLTHYG